MSKKKSVPNMSGYEINQTISRLVDNWCDKRNLSALRAILRAWPMPMGLTDDWAHLLDALKDLRGIYRDALSEDELAVVDHG